MRKYRGPAPSVTVEWSSRTLLGSRIWSASRILHFTCCISGITSLISHLLCISRIISLVSHLLLISHLLLMSHLGLISNFLAILLFCRWSCSCYDSPSSKVILYLEFLSYRMLIADRGSDFVFFPYNVLGLALHLASCILHHNLPVDHCALLLLASHTLYIARINHGE